MFKNLPHRIFDIILSQIGVKYFHTGDMVHEEARQMEFVGIVFVGSVQYSVGRGQVICEKGTVIMS